MLNSLRNWWLRLRYPPLPEAQQTQRCVARVDAPDGNRRIEFFERDDGLFQFEEQTFDRGEGYECWLPSHCSGLYESLEIARADAVRELPWMRAGV